MSRDYRNFRTFQRADQLVLEIYKLSSGMPPTERYGLQSQIRRAAVSTATNIVEGSARGSDPEYARFLEISMGSARECEYLVHLASRLDLIDAKRAGVLGAAYSQVQAELFNAIRFWRRKDRVRTPAASRSADGSDS